MAETNRGGTNSFHAHRSNVLNYGHFGTATYNTRDHTWHFLRLRDEVESGDDELSDEQARDGIEVIEGLTRLQPPVFSWKLDEAATEHNSWASAKNALLQTAPELCATAEVKTLGLFENNHLGTASLPTSNTGGVVFGGALLLGDNDSQSGSALAPIMMSVHGPARDQLVFSRLERTTLSCFTKSGKRIEAELPQITYNDAHVWPSPGAIKFVTVSSRASSQSHSRFAIITQAGTTIFQPRLHRSNTTTPLDPNHIIDIPLMYTGGQRHVDVAFHPQMSNVIAIVDAQGTWSTWEMTGKSLHSIRRRQLARLLASGSVTKDLREIHDANFVPADSEWHRICWLSSKDDTIDRLAVCNRWTLCLFDLVGNLLGPVDLKSRKGIKAGPILDIISSTSSTSDCFVLTNSHLLWLSTATHDPATVQSKQGLATVVSWNHFRARTDHSLSMHVIEHEQETRIVLCSKFTKITTMYRAVKSSGGGFSIAEPSPLILPFDHSSHSNRLCFKTTQVKSQHGASKQGEPWLCKIVNQHTDGTIEECTLYLSATTINKEADAASSDQIDLPKPQSYYHQSTRMLGTDNNDDFVVDDINSTNDHVLDPPIDDRLKDSESQAISAQGNDARCDLGPTYSNIVDSTAILKGHTRSVQQFQTALEDLLKSADGSFAGRLLSEMPIKVPYIAEIEEDSASLSNYLDSTHYEDTGEAADSGGRFDLEMIDDQSLMNTYESLVRQWMLPLSPNIPDRTRIFQERLARQIAFEVWLSNVVIYRSEVTSAPELHSSRSPGNDIEHEQVPPSSFDHEINTQELHASEMSARPDETKSSQSSSLLSSLVHFTKPLPAYPLSSSFEEIITHLPSSIDENPSQYDYDKVESQFAAAQAELTHSQLDNRTRRKAEKLSRSRQRQLDKQEQAKRVTFDARSVVPDVSSSQLPYRGIQSSQAGPPDSSRPGRQSPSAINMSQPERGPFGGRSSKKSKKSKGERRAGF